MNQMPPLCIAATAVMIVAAPTPRCIANDPTQAEGKANAIDFSSLGREVVRIIREDFLDEKRAEAWADRHADYARDIHDENAFAKRTNEILAELKTSHTQYYRPNELAYWGIAAIFSEGLELGDVTYESIGVDVDGRGFVRSVYAGGPADDAGLKRGDRIAAADGKPFEPVNSFKGKADQTVRLTIQRTADGSPINSSVTPHRVNPRKEWLEAMRAGVRIIKKGDTSVAYAPMYWTVGEDFRDLITELIAERFHEADALIVDFRDGFGGTNPQFLNYFNNAPPHIELIDRHGITRDFDPQWRKPVVLLINGGTRSGKEIVAHALKQRHLAKLVGTRTAGFVVGGRPFLLSDRSILYVAVVDSLVDGTRLEGVGVTPHVVVPDRLDYAAGADPQLDRAVEVAAELARVPDTP